MKEKITSFFGGSLYPILAATIIFLGHTFSCELFSIILLILSLIAATLLCDDMRVAIAPVLMIAFSFSYKTYLSGWLGSTTFAVLAIKILGRV